MADISFMIEEQKVLFNHLKRITRSYEVKAGKTCGFAQTIFDEIEQTSQLFKEKHSQLLNIVRDNSITMSDIPYFAEEVFYQFQDEFFSLKSQLLDFMKDAASSSPLGLHSTFSAPSHSRNETMPAEARLPKIDIPTFSGDYLAWISYKDMFTSLVHNNHGLSNVQKYYFLKGSCSGTPLDIVNEYPASDASYVLAWNALNDRYHNKRKIVDTLLRKLFSIPNSTGSAESIQIILDMTRNSLSLLRALEVSTDGWDALLIYMTVNKLDMQTRKEWEQSLKASTEIPPIKDLFNFLETSFRTLETLNDTAQLNFASFSRISANNSFQSRPRNTFRRNVHLTTYTTDANCLCCNKRHLLFKCFKFAAMSPDAKREFLNSKRICRNCLNVGHFSYNCHSSSRCQSCQQNHHTTLHNLYTTNNNNVADNYNVSQQVVGCSSTDEQSADNAPNNIVCNCGTLNNEIMPQVLLATIRVVLKTPHGNFHLRAILDQCAQASFITQNAADSLRLPTNKTLVQISGVGGNQPYTSRKIVQIVLFSDSEDQFKLNCKALVLPKITSYQPLSIDKEIYLI